MHQARESPMLSKDVISEKCYQDVSVWNQTVNEQRTKNGRAMLLECACRRRPDGSRSTIPTHTYVRDWKAGRSSRKPEEKAGRFLAVFSREPYFMRPMQFPNVPNYARITHLKKFAPYFIVSWYVCGPVGMLFFFSVCAVMLGGSCVFFFVFSCETHFAIFFPFCWTEIFSTFRKKSEGVGQEQRTFLINETTDEWKIIHPIMKLAWFYECVCVCLWMCRCAQLPPPFCPMIYS